MPGRALRLLHLGGGGRTVLVLPGVAGGVGLFRPNLQAASGAGARVVGVDLAGDRADDPRERFDWPGFVGEIGEAIDRAGAARPVLWGNSFGAILALAFAAQAPERISALLLNGPPWPPPWPGAVRALLRLAAPPARRPGWLARYLFRASFCPAVLWEFVAPGALGEMRRLYREATEACTPDRTVVEKLRLLYEHPPRLALPPALPTLLVRGRHDPFSPRRGARALCDGSPLARLVEIPRCGHAVNFSARARFDDEVRRFLSGLPGRRAEPVQPRRE